MSSTNPRHSMPVIYAYIEPPGTTPTDRQSYGSPISRVWEWTWSICPDWTSNLPALKLSCAPTCPLTPSSAVSLTSSFCGSREPLLGSHASAESLAPARESRTSEFFHTQHHTASRWRSQPARVEVGPRLRVKHPSRPCRRLRRSGFNGETKQTWGASGRL